MSLPRFYKQAAFKVQGGPLMIEQVPLKLPGAREILVKVDACGVCFSDMFAQNNVMGGGFPLVPGHEIIGRVAAVGEEVSLWKVGDRVGAGWHGGHDGTGFHTIHIMMYPSPLAYPDPLFPDAEYALLRSEAVARIPENLDAAKYAPIMCAGMTVFNSIRNMGVGPGERVAVQGLGGVGHLAIQYANRFGYRVVAISRDASKEKFARELGAHEYIDSSAGDAGEQLQKLGGAKLVVATAPTADVMTPLLKGLGILGKLLILSVPGEVTVNTGVMLKYGVSVQSWPCGHATDSEDTIRFTELSNIDCMIEKFPLDRANEAYSKQAYPVMLSQTIEYLALSSSNEHRQLIMVDHMLSGKARFRAVITME